MRTIAGHEIPGGLRLASSAGAPLLVALLGAVLLGRIPAPVIEGLGLGIGSSALVAMLVWYAFRSAVSALVAAAAIAILAGRARGAASSGPQALLGLSRAWNLWVAGLLYALLVIAGLAFLIVPGFLLGVAGVLYGPATVLGRRTPLEALAASFGRASSGWRTLVRRMAGPFAFYGAVYALAAAPFVFSLAHYAAYGGTLSIALASYLRGVGVPDWFEWGLVPVLFTLARLYFLAGVTSAWLALEN